MKMKKIYRISLIAIGGLAGAVLIGPFLIPVPPLKDTVPPRQLADPDSRFVEVNGLQVHYKQAGQGEPALILLHGFGASVFSWQTVMPELAKTNLTVAFDRPAFGLTERPMPGQWRGPGPYGSQSQVGLTLALMDNLGIDRAVPVGHSVSLQIGLLDPIPLVSRSFTSG